MKKHAEADAFAARLAAAANQPPVIVHLPVGTAAQSEAMQTPSPTSDEPTASIKAPIRKKRSRTKANAEVPEKADDDTVPISLRPPRDLLTRYVVAASDRMRETGRAISAQQIMLEVLECGP